eukprot:TRINITY_DN9561_c0_g1_i4.p1 TRINITY_DN9561_c0_g1~~TRINITY_DN9561_c0_g1_i4.p1  ORF type:complete len:622 (-),score=62.01 TRINITY_DN9561_c0_g1_i4:53-1918(-)
MNISRIFLSYPSVLSRSTEIIPRMKLYHTNTDYVPLIDVIKRRKNEAKRSIMVQVKSKESAADLFSYCNHEMGKIAGMYYHHNHFNKSFPNFYIIEFEDENSVTKVISSSVHIESGLNNCTIPVTSPFLWFSSPVSGMKRASSTTSSLSPSELSLVHDEESPGIDIKKTMSLSEQIFQMSNMTMIPESHTRVRFLLCRQIELMLQGMFHNCSVLPFGSSVNGFGKYHGDQDMILSLNGFHMKANQENQSRLVFHSKSNSHGGDIGQIRRYCDQVSSIIQGFMPGCQDVQKILFARVPIIKYRQELVGIDCGLAFNNTSGFLMSCLMHIFVGLDWRVRPLASFIKEWAKSNKLIKDARPTNYFTNFQIVLMVVCYLQQVHHILPSVLQLNQLASEEDRYVCEGGLEATFLHNVAPHITKLNPNLHSDTDIFELVHGFFDFYGTTNYTQRRLNPIKGEMEAKTTTWKKTAALDIINPLDPEMNVSHNVSQPALKQFTDLCRFSQKKCVEIKKKEGNVFADELFGKDSQKAFSFPNILDIGLGKVQSDSAATKQPAAQFDSSATKQPADQPDSSTTKEPAVMSDSSTTKKPAKSRRKKPLRLDKDKKEKLVQMYGHSLYLKQKL